LTSNLEKKFSKTLLKTKPVANEESKQNKNVDSPELEDNTNFFFSRRNFYPRQHNLERKKFNPFDYFSNNYMPSKVSPRKNQVTMAYYNLAEQPRRDSAQFKKNDDFINTFYNYSTLYYKDPNFQRTMKSENLSTKSTSPNLSTTDINLTKSSSETSSKRDSSNSLPEESKCEAKKTHFVERQGDWICMRCKNLNFSFRIVCNRCKISKAESEMLYEGHMQNIYNIIKYNELIQSQILLTQGQMPNFTGKGCYQGNLQKTPSFSMNQEREAINQ